MKRNCLKHSVNFPNKIKRKGKKPKSKKHKNKFIRKDQGNSKTQLMFPLEIFHIFNQGNNGEIIFHNDSDKQRFYDLLRNYLEPVAYIYCFALLSNHFHYLIKIKSRDKILSLIDKDQRIANFAQKFIDQGKTKAYIAARIVSEQLRLFFSKYASRFNLKYSRKGSLLRKNFKRKRIESATYLRNCIVYINRNITNHFPNISYKDYKWCSYSNFLDPDYIDRLNKRYFDFYSLFGDIENFIYLHERKDLDHLKYMIE